MSAQQSPSLNLSITPVRLLPLPSRALTVLRKARIETVADLVGRSEVEISILPGAGEYTMRRIKAALAAHGLACAPDSRRETHVGPSSAARPRRPAADLCFGDTRFGFAIGRLGL